MDAIPLKGMGRFSHEAVAVDPLTNHIYETEDQGDTSGFYRYVPNEPNAPGLAPDFTAGGTLQMRDQESHSTNRTDRPWAGTEAEWVGSDPDPNGERCRTVFSQGFNRGGAARSTADCGTHGHSYRLTTEATLCRAKSGVYPVMSRRSPP